MNITRPDGFCDSHVWFYNGCFFHGHDPSECHFKSKANKAKQDEKRALFNKKIDLLKQRRPELDVSIMWECQWRQAKRENPEIKHFLGEVYHSPPQQRLNPRDCIRGGLNEVFCLHWSDKLYPTENMYYLDMNAFYTHIAMVSDFPTGPYEVCS